MALYALDAVDDAFRAMRGFLTPVDRTRWLKLALVGLFVGLPGVGANSAQYNVPANGDGAPAGELPEVPTEAWLVVAAAVGLALVLALAVLLVGSVMEFVFVESLRSDEVRVRAYWRRYFRRGLRLFGFRLVVGLVVLAAVLLLTGAVFLPVALGDGGASVVFLVLVLLPFFVVLAVVVGLLNGFTTMFVVPAMLLENCGVVAGWRRFWPTLTDEWTEYLAYAVASVVLSLGGAILVGVVTAILTVVLLVPFGVLFAVGVGFLFLFEPLGVAALVFAGLSFALVVVAVAAVVQVPVLVYLRYYALFLLGETNERFDLVPDQRAAARD